MSAIFRPPLLRWVAASGVAVPLTGTTSETTLATLTVPGGVMPSGGILRAITLWSMTGSTNGKTMRLKFGGTNFMGVVITTATIITGQYLTVIRNRGATNSQIGNPANFVGIGSGTTALVTASVDTTADVTLLITGQLVSSGETLTLEGYNIEVAAP